MRYPFVKMHGAGNDYIYMDGFNGHRVPPDPSEASIHWSRRRFAVGSDGLILILPHSECDAEMRIFNADGSEAKMCGNGIRCVGKYLYDNRLVDKQTIAVMTQSGVKTLRLVIDKETDTVESVVVDMGAPCFEPEKIPVNAPKANDVTLQLGDLGSITVDCVSMGNPHAVCFVRDVDALDLEKIGPYVEKHAIFPDSVNTEFVEIIDSNTLKFRVWERGSGETLACGTGICAACVIAVAKGICRKDEKITVYARGGIVEIVVTSAGPVYMSGPAEIAFRGEVELPE